MDANELGEMIRRLRRDPALSRRRDILAVCDAAEQTLTLTLVAKPVTQVASKPRDPGAWATYMRAYRQRERAILRAARNPFA